MHEALATPSAPRLFAAAWAALLTPGWVFYDMAPHIVQSIHSAQALLWLAAFALLVVIVHGSPVAAIEVPAGDGHSSTAASTGAGGRLTP